MQIDSPELEWYYPLLKPYEHYIPMVANESWVNLEEVIGWAEAHQEEVAKIVENATAFAIRYLSAQGRSVPKACSVCCLGAGLSTVDAFCKQLAHPTSRNLA